MPQNKKFGGKIVFTVTDQSKIDPYSDFQLWHILTVTSKGLNKPPLSLVQTGDKDLVTSRCSFILLPCREDKENEDKNLGDKTRQFTRETREPCLVPIFLTSCRDEQKVETRNGSCRCRQYWYKLLPLLGLRPFQVEIIFYDHPREWKVF